MGMFESLNPKKVYKKTKAKLKSGNSAEIFHAISGTTGVHGAVRSYRDKKKEEESEELFATGEAEQAAVGREKITAAKKKLEAQRKSRRGRAGRKGRRASIMTGPLGAGKEPEVRRAGVLGA